MFEKFTEGSRAVLLMARREAQRLGSDYIGTEHLLLGLLFEPRAAGVLSDLYLDSGKIRDELFSRITPVAPSMGFGQLPFSTRSRRALQLAAEAASEGETFVDVRHLILGLLGEGQGIAARVLRSAGGANLVPRKLEEPALPDPVLSVEYNPPGTCPVCLTALSELNRVACEKCRAHYHSECWEYNRRHCAVFGCFKSAPEYAPFATRRRVDPLEASEAIRVLEQFGYVQVPGPAEAPAARADVIGLPAAEAGWGVDRETLFITLGMSVLIAVLWFFAAAMR